MAHDVFISYSTVDKAIADAVCSRFESGGIRCWYAPRDIEPGADWAGSIIDAIAVTKVMVLIFTPDSNISKQVLRELDCAVSAGVTVIPMRLTREDPIESMRYYLSAVHWLDAVDEKLDASIDQLYLLCRAVIDTRDGAVLPRDSQEKKKVPSKTRTVIIAAAALCVLLAVLILPKVLSTQNTVKTEESGQQAAARTEDSVPASDAEPAQDDTEGYNAPVGEKSKNAGVEPDHFIEGTTQGNIHAGGFIAYDDGWYYFRSNDEEKLYKMREDGSEAQKLSDHSARKIMVHDGYVYFEEEHGYIGIYRVKTDGTEEKQIYGSETPFMGIIGEKLYFVSHLDGLCAMDLTQEFDDYTWGGETVYDNEKVIDSIYEMCFDGKNIYYLDFNTKGIWRASIDGGKPEKIVKTDASDLVLAGDYLYYNDLSDYGLKAWNTKTGEILTAAPFFMNYYHIRADGIYGSSYDDGILIRYDPSTGVKYELSDRQVTYVCLANEKIFYWDFNKFYATNLDGRKAIGL